MLGLAVALAALVAASIYDLRSREVPLWLVVTGYVAAAAVHGVEVYLAGAEPLPILVYATAVNAVVIVAVYALVRIGYMGEGDLAAYGLVWASTALKPMAGCCVFPLLFTSLTYSVALQVSLALAILVYNLALHRRELSVLPIRLRLLYSFTAVPVRASKAVSMEGWWYPLTLCRKRVSAFDVREDAWKLREELRRDIESGCIKPDDTVWVSYGIPAVPFIAAGLALAILVHDRLILLPLRLAGWEWIPCIG